MKPIDISTQDLNSYNDFVAGNSIQVRIEVAEPEVKDFSKNKIIKVVHAREETTAKIVSDPLIVSSSSEKGPKTLSLIIEKVD